MIFFHASKYLKYIILSRHWRGHGIHSPFIFDLVTRVFRNKTDDHIVLNIEKIRKRLISDHRSIDVLDLGAGSGKLKSLTRKVSHIAKYSPVPRKYGLLLSALAAEFGNPFIMELGTSFGFSTMYMASSSPDTMVYTIEGCPEIARIATENFTELHLQNVNLFTGSFEENLPVIMNADRKPGLVFIDGNHRKEPVLNYFKFISGLAELNTLIIIDDIYYSKEMEEAWNEIKCYENVSFTIDIFRMGLVFFRKGISQQNYVIRY
jgi:predicted O-methyltransferase YrrM